jgi:hypothetical protein
MYLVAAPVPVGTCESIRALHEPGFPSRTATSVVMVSVAGCSSAAWANFKFKVI